MKNNLRFAYCIIAYNEPELLTLLVDLLDDERNDIYVMIDKKSDISEFQHLRTQKSRLTFTQHRVDVRWGDLSLVEAEYTVFKEAFYAGRKYDYFHLLSGVDLPLKSQDEIHNIIQSVRGGEYIEIQQGTSAHNMLERRLRYYHLFNGHKRDKIALRRFFFVYLRKVLLALQVLLNVRRKHLYSQYGIGSNWVSITSDFLEYLLSQESTVLKTFKYTSAPDEIFLQTIILNSPYKGCISRDGNMRSIDWTRGNGQGSPYIWHNSDYDQLIHSDKLFARKFSMKEDSQIVQRIYQYVKSKNEYSEDSK